MKMGVWKSTVITPRQAATRTAGRRTGPQPERSPAPNRAEQLALDPLPGDYRLPPLTLLRPGEAARARTKANAFSGWPTWL